MFDYEDRNPFDEGPGSEPTVDDAADLEAAPQSDTREETVPDSSTAPSSAEETEAGDKVSDEGEKPEGEKEEEGEKPETEKTLDETLADVDQHIADEKHPKWFRHALERTKTAFLNETARLKSDFEPVEAFGKPEKIVEDLSIMQGLDAFETDPATNLPRPTVKPFVESLVEKRGLDTAVAVMRELGNQPSPQNPGWTLMHEVFAASGLNPERIDDFKRFQENGYQLHGAAEGILPPTAEELALVPEHLREAFCTLNPEQRDKMLTLDQEMMEMSLSGVQSRLDKEREEREKESQKAQQERKTEASVQQEFYRAVNEGAQRMLDESGSRLFSSFTESLVRAGSDEFDAINIANGLSMLLNSNGVEGRATRAALEKIGVKVDAELDSLFKEWMETGSRAAAFERQNAMLQGLGDKETAAKRAALEKIGVRLDPNADPQNLKKTMERFAELEQRLIRKATPIVAGIIEHRAKASAARISTRNKAIDETTKINNGLAPRHGNPAPIAPKSGGGRDFSEEYWDSRNPFE